MCSDLYTSVFISVFVLGNVIMTWPRQCAVDARFQRSCRTSPLCVFWIFQNFESVHSCDICRVIWRRFVWIKCVVLDQFRICVNWYVVWTIVFQKKKISLVVRWYVVIYLLVWHDSDIWARVNNLAMSNAQDSPIFSIGFLLCAIIAPLVKWRPFRVYLYRFSRNLYELGQVTSAK